MLLRVMRAMSAPWGMPRASAGRIRCCAKPAGLRESGTYPLTGSHGRATANSTTSPRPSAKSGTDRPTTAAAIAPRSVGELGRVAARTPIGTPMRTAQVRAAAVRLKVTGSRPRIASRTGCPRKNDRPSSPRTTRESHRTNCTGSGWSSPSRTRSSATACGLASIPSSTAAGSPGMRRMRANAAAPMISQAGTSSMIRRAT